MLIGQMELPCSKAVYLCLPAGSLDQNGVALWFFCLPDVLHGGLWIRCGDHPKPVQANTLDPAPWRGSPPHPTIPPRLSWLLEPLQDLLC